MQNINGESPAIEVAEVVVKVGVAAYTSWEIGSKVYHTVTKGRNLGRDSLSLAKKAYRFGRGAYRKIAKLSRGRWSSFYWF